MKINYNTSNSTIFLVIMLVVAMVIGGPLITIWALNTLFSLNIGFNITTWFAMLWIQSVMIAKVSSN